MQDNREATASTEEQEEGAEGEEDDSMDFPEEESDQCESLFDYVSLKGGAYRDLTHEEVIRMREAYQQKLLLDRRVRWLKARALPDPEREAAAIIKQHSNPQVGRYLLLPCLLRMLYFFIRKRSGLHTHKNPELLRSPRSCTSVV